MRAFFTFSFDFRLSSALPSTKSILTEGNGPSELHQLANNIEASEWMRQQNEGKVTLHSTKFPGWTERRVSGRTLSRSIWINRS
jgi:hypothetical protein